MPAAGVLQPDGSNECNNNLTTDCLRVYNKRQYNTKFKTIDPFAFALWKLSVHLGIHMYLLTLSGSSFHVLVQQHISHAVASLSLFLSCHFAPPPQSPPAKQILAAELCCCRSLLNHRSSILNMCLLGACCYLQYLRQMLLWLQSHLRTCLLYTSPSPRDRTRSRMPSSA